jgi:hypothetical protein
MCNRKDYPNRVVPAGATEKIIPIEWYQHNIIDGVLITGTDTAGQVGSP